MKIAVHCLLLGSLLLSGCWGFGRVEPGIGEIDAYVPVYAKEGDAELAIAIMPSREATVAGKIFVIGEKLFQVEEGQGIHIIDYADKKNPKKLSFLNIPGCGEVAVKGQSLYTNNFEDLLVLDLSSYPEVKVTARKPGVFPEMDGQHPPRGYYQCPDPMKGRVIKWELKKVDNPKCFY